MKSFLSAHKWELVMILTLLLFSLAVLGVMRGCRTEGVEVVVQIDGESVASYPLGVNGEFRLNGGTNVLVIEGGCAYLTYADCPDRTCVRTGKIRFVGESIVCLPNRLSVTVRGSSDGGVDFVS